MSSFDPTSYFSRKLGSLTAPKQESITWAMEEKVRGLEKYRQAVADGRAFLDPDRSALDALKDSAITAIKGAVLLPESAVGLADIVSGGRAGNALEDLGYRPQDARELLDAWFSPAQKEAKARVDLEDTFLGTVRAAVENPSVVLEQAGQAVPSMLGGAAVARGLLATGSRFVTPAVAAGAGEGLVGAGAAASQIRGQTEDGLLTPKQAAAALGTGAVTGLLGFAGARAAQGLGIPDIDSALAAGTLKTPAGFVKAVAGAGITEGVFEEMPQSAQEQIWQNWALDKPLMEGVPQAAGLGLVTGAAMGGGIGGLSAAASAGGDKDKKTEAEQTIAKQMLEAQQQAISTGDVSVLMDTKSQTYNPSAAIAALDGYSAEPSRTPEQRAEKIAEAEEIVATLQRQKENAELLVQQATPEGLAALKQEAAAARASGSDALAAALDQEIKAIEDGGASAQRARQTQLARIEDQFTKAQENLSRFKAAETLRSAPSAVSAVPGSEDVALSSTATPTSEDIGSLVESLRTPVDPSDPVQVETRTKQAALVINLSMRAPDSLSDTQALELAETPDNGLSEPQRDYLRKFSRAKQEQNKAKRLNTVQKEVFEGGKGYVGLAQYESQMAVALDKQNKTEAERLLNQLERFKVDHVGKATAARDAWAQGKGTQIEKANGQWRIRTGEPLSRDELRASGSLEMNSEQLVEAIVREARAINATQQQLRAAFDLQFSPAAATTAPVTTTSTEFSDVSDVPQPYDATQDASGGSQESQAAEPAAAGSGVDVVEAGATRSAGTGSVASGEQRGAAESASAEVTAAGVEPRNGFVEALDTDVAYKAWSNVQDGSDRDVFRSLIAETEQMMLSAGKNLDITKATITEDLKNQKWFRASSPAQRTAAIEALLQAIAKQREEKRLKGLANVAAKKAEQEAGAKAQQLKDIADITQTGVSQENAEKVIQLRSDIARIQASMKDRRETGPDAEAAVNSKQARIAKLQEQINSLLKSTKAKTSLADSAAQSADQESSEVSLDPTTPTESPEGTSVDAQTTEVVEQDPGGLALLTKAARQAAREMWASMKGAEAWTKVNRFQAFITQKRTKIDSDEALINSRPLVEIKDFLSRLNAGDIDFESLLERDALSQEQDPEGKSKEALKAFQRFAMRTVPVLRGNLIKGSLKNSKRNTVAQDQLFRDPIQDLLDEQGQTEENVLTALSFAAFSWFSDQAMHPLKDDEDILKMHSLKPETGRVSAKGRARLRWTNTFENLAVNELGAIVVSALGLKADADAPQNYLPNLKAALGVHALRMLESQGYIKVERIKQEVVAQWLGQEFDGSKEVVNTYVSLVRDPKTKKLVDRGRSIADVMQGSADIVNRLFGVERVPTEATTVPMAFTQKYAKGTQQTIPKFLKDVLAKAQKVEHRVIPDMWKLLNAVGDSVVLQAAGFRDLSSGKVQATELESVEAQNENLTNQLQMAKGLVNGALAADSKSGLNQPFFINYEVWRNFRVGVTTRNLNPQSSKIHRFMFYRPDWESKIDFSKPEQEEQFLVSVAQAFGVKVDQQRNSKTLAKDGPFEKKAAGELTEYSQKLYAAIAKNKPLTPAEQQKVGELAAGAEGMQTLQAMVMYGKYLAAKDAGETSVTVQMLVGVDGKTNGPIMSHIALGAASSAQELYNFIKRGGMYRSSDKVKNFNEWFEGDDSQDLYEDLSGAVLRRLNQLIGNEVDPKLAQAVETITKKLIDKDTNKVTSAGRKIVKTPLTSFAFGSSVAKSMENMKAAFVQSVVDRITDLANEENPAASKTKLIQALNTLFQAANPNAPTIQEDNTVEELMSWKISEAQAADLENAFEQVFGTAVQETMESYFESFITRRNAVNSAIGLGFSIYKSVYEDLRNAEIQRLMDAGEIKFDSRTETDPKTKKKTLVRYPLQDLTAEQEAVFRKQVAKFLPQMHSAYSQRQGDLGAGIYLAKEDAGMSYEPMHTVAVQLGTLYEPSPGKYSSQITANAKIDKEKSPGVAGLPYAMHSLDSFIMHLSLLGTQTLNVHDEAGNGVLNVIETARKINQSAWTGLLEYSPSEQAYQMLSRAVINAQELQAQGVLSADAMAQIRYTATQYLRKAQIKPKKGEPVIAMALALAKRQFFNAEQIRLEALSQMAHMDQYTWEGGQYDITEADRQRAIEKLAELRKQGSELTKAEANAAAALENGRSGAVDIVEVPQDVTEAVEEIEPFSVFGALGKPEKLEQALVSFFKNNDNPSLKDTFAALEKLIAGKEQTRANKTYGELLKLLKTVVPADTRIQVVRPGTSLNDVLELPGADKDGKRTAYGWYIAKDGKAVIYLLGEEFVNSGMASPQILLHELVHAATAIAIQTNKSPEVVAAIQELEALRAKVAEHAKKTGQFEQFQTALADLDEFVAYGMTQPSFQKLLSAVTMQSKTKKSALVDGFKSFIKSIVDVLFAGSTKSRQAIAVNGLTLLVQNTAAIMNATKQTPDIVASTAINLSAKVHDYSTLEISEALNAGDMSPEFAGQIQRVLENISSALHGPFSSLKTQLEQDMEGELASTPEETWLQSVRDGKAPVALEVQSSPFKVSDRELHAMEQIELTVRAALEAPEARVRMAYKELAELFQEMKQKIPVSAFADPEEHAFIFNIKPGPDGKSHHLARFAAFALAHEGFNKLMQQPSNTDQRKLFDVEGFANKVQVIFEKILSFWEELLLRTYKGQRADSKVEALLQNIIKHEAQKRVSIARALYNEQQGPSGLEKFADGLTNSARNAVLALADSNLVRRQQNGFIRLGAAFVRLQAKDQVDWFLKELTRFRDKMLPGLHGLPTEIVNQLKGPGMVVNLLQLMSTNMQRHRKHIITQTSKAALMAFQTKLTRKDGAKKAAITQVFMRTGMHNLLSRYSMADIEKLTEQGPFLTQAIADVQEALRNAAGKPLLPFVEHYINKANALGYFRVTGKNRTPMLMMNAHNIARLYGTAFQSRVSQAQAEAVEPLIAQLVALYGLKYVTAKDAKLARDIAREENGRTDGGNGVQFVLEFHRQLEKASEDRLFKNQKALMMHGHTPDIYNPNTALATAPMDEKDTLLNQGYKLLYPLPMDPADPDTRQKGLFILRDGGLARFQTGVVSLSSKAQRGTTKHSGYLNVNTVGGLENALMNADILYNKGGGLERGAPQDLRQVDGTFLAPVLNPSGEIVNWRYLMEDKNKDKHLERDNRMEVVLGALAGSIYDKETTPEVNRKAFQALKDIYEAERFTDPDSFVVLGPRSTESRLKEIWDLLPEESKQDARAMFGIDGLYVRKDLLLPVFGYRQYSLAEMFKKDPKDRALAEKLIADSIEWLYSTSLRMNSYRTGSPMSVEESRKKAKAVAVAITRGERMWQEVVHEIKDIIVVKSGIVLLGNMFSNLSQLVLSGVPLRSILRDHIVAMRAARSYEEDQEALDQLQAQMATNTVPNGIDAQQEIARLQDSLARNPVGELIEAGLMPTIVEDVQADDDLHPYSYKSQLTRKTDKYINKLPDALVSFGKGVYMAHDTRLYQGLSRLTRLSDFMGRYTLYQHLTTTKQKDGKLMSKEEALHEASEAFVNYDSPLPKELQYLDQMGIIPFTKYYLRIQRVLLKMVKNNPGRVLGTLLLNNFVDLGPIVLESSWIHRIGNNPMQWGALQYPGTLDELGTIAAATAVVK